MLMGTRKEEQKQNKKTNGPIRIVAREVGVPMKQMCVRYACREAGANAKQKKCKSNVCTFVHITHTHTHALTTTS